MIHVDEEKHIWIECCMTGVTSCISLTDAIEEWNKRLLYYGARYRIADFFPLGKDLAEMREKLK